MAITLEEEVFVDSKEVTIEVTNQIFGSDLSKFIFSSFRNIKRISIIQVDESTYGQGNKLNYPLFKFPPQSFVTGFGGMYFLGAKLIRFKASVLKGIN